MHDWKLRRGKLDNAQIEGSGSTGTGTGNGYGTSVNETGWGSGFGYGCSTSDVGDGASIFKEFELDYLSEIEILAFCYSTREYDVDK